MTGPVQSCAPQSNRGGWRLDLALGLLFLAATLAAAPHALWTSHPPVPYGAEQTNIAHALAAGRGFADPQPLPSGPTAWVPPLWPSIIALIYRCFGVDTAPASHVLAGLQYLLAAYTLFALLRCWRRSAGWAGRVLLAAVYFLLAFPLVRTLAAENADDLWIVWALLASLLWLATGDGWRWSRLLGFSLLGALSILAHAGAGLAFLVTAGVCLWLDRPPGQSPRPSSSGSLGARISIVYLGAVLAAGGWAGRNYERFHALIPLKSTFWFEIGLTLLPPDHSGVLTVSDMLLRHPSGSPRVNAHLAEVGEPRFMAEQRQAVMAALRRDPIVLGRQVWRRTVNALAYADPVVDAREVLVRLPEQDLKTLQQAGLVWVSPDHRPTMWVNLGRPTAGTVRAIAVLPLENKEGALRDWARAASEFHASATSWTAVWTRLLYGTLPALCLFWGAWRSRRTGWTLLTAAGVAYFAVLAPNILITHNLAHQFRFVPLQVVLIAGTVWDVAGPIAARLASSAKARAAGRCRV